MQSTKMNENHKTNEKRCANIHSAKIKDYLVKCRKMISLIMRHK